MTNINIIKAPREKRKQRHSKSKRPKGKDASGIFLENYASKKTTVKHLTELIKKKKVNMSILNSMPNEIFQN